jgi:hypothetical protein
MPLLELRLVVDLAFEPSLAFGSLTFRFVVEGDVVALILFAWFCAFFLVIRLGRFSFDLSETAV